MDIHSPVKDIRGVFPKFSDKVFAGIDLSLIGSKKGKDFEFLLREDNLLTIHVDHLVLHIYLQTSAFKHCRKLWLNRSHATKYCAHARYHFVDRERLRNIIVASGRKTGKKIVLRSLGRKENYRNLIVQLGTDHLRHGKTGHSSHHHVQKYKSMFGTKDFKGFFRRSGTIGCITGILKVELKDLPDVCLVIYYKYLSFHI